MHTLRIGLLGCGVVGGGFVRLLASDRERILSRYGLDIEVSRILVRDLDRIRPGVESRLLTRSAIEVIDRDCDVVVELIGGTASASCFIRRAIDLGRDVVTANKALLAERGGEIFSAAAKRGVAVGFEASICGAIPIIRALQRGLAGDTIERITGILNGTCNYILTRMERGLSFGEALSAAQKNGFAEADATLDVDGIDASQKLQILAGLAFDAPVRRQIVTGIRTLTTADLENAARRGKSIRLIAEAQRIPGGVELRVEPREIATDDPLARVVDENNAVQIRGRAAGELLLVGKGAGSMPTATAVLSDVVEIGSRRSASATAVA